jgi:hypothetical protein
LFFNQGAEQGKSMLSTNRPPFKDTNPGHRANVVTGDKIEGQKGTAGIKKIQGEKEGVSVSPSPTPSLMQHGYAAQPITIRRMFF